VLTIVMTNHGPRGAVDDTPYSHYSLLRTIEDAFGIGTHLNRASAPGVVPMTKLFALTSAHV
ncbi:MAG: phosphoesterase, partial [Vulcanimicrobiaceae bacterium]